MVDCFTKTVFNLRAGRLDEYNKNLGDPTKLITTTFYQLAGYETQNVNWARGIAKYESMKAHIEKYVGKQIGCLSVEDIGATYNALNEKLGLPDRVLTPAQMKELQAKRTAESYARYGSKFNVSKSRDQEMKEHHQLHNRGVSGGRIATVDGIKITDIVKSNKASKPDSVFSSSEPTQTIMDIIPSIPEAQAVTSNGNFIGAVQPDPLPSIVGSIEYAVQNVPQAVSMTVINITEKSASIEWTPNPNDIITKYHFVLKQENQTIKETNLLSGQRNFYASNLIPNTNYKAYLMAINIRGNSPETSIGFKTLGSTPIVTTPVIIPQVSDMGKVIPAVTTPVVTTPIITLSAETKSIINKFNSGVYQVRGTYPLSTIIELVKNGKMSNEDFIKTVKANLEYGQFFETKFGDTPILQEPNSDSYEIKLTNASYMGTSKGKTVNIQTSINLTGIPSKSIHARIQIKNSSGISIYQNFQNLSVGGGQTFPLVFNIPDLGKEEEVISGGEATAVINYKIVLWKSLNNPVALTPFPLTGQLVYDSEVILPNPETGEVEDKNSLLGKVMGVTALLGTLALLGSKGR